MTYSQKCCNNPYTMLVFSSDNGLGGFLVLCLLEMFMATPKNPKMMNTLIGYCGFLLYHYSFCASLSQHSHRALCRLGYSRTSFCALISRALFLCG